jgi:hypothetical protein
MGLTRGTYTITSAGLKWIEGEPMPGAPETLQIPAERPEGTEPRGPPLQTPGRAHGGPGGAGCSGASVRSVCASRESSLLLPTFARIP